MTALVLNERNIDLVNSLRNAAMKASADFNAVKFFADFEYARACLARFATSGVPELAALAGRASENLFRQPAAERPQVALPEPVRAQAPAAAPIVEVIAPTSNRYTPAKELMNGLAVDAAGLRSMLFVLQLERASCTADLIALLPRFQKLLSRSIGEMAAGVMVEQVRRVL